MHVSATRQELNVLLEYISGGGLDVYVEMISRSSHLLEIVAHILNETLLAVEYLHVEGIIHRDLKPQNLLLTGGEQGASVRITDFGVSAQLTEGSSLATSSMAAMPPSRIRAVNDV